MILAQAPLGKCEYQGKNNNYNKTTWSLIFTNKFSMLIFKVVVRNNESHELSDTIESRENNLNSFADSATHCQADDRKYLHSW